MLPRTQICRDETCCGTESDAPLIPASAKWSCMPERRPFKVRLAVSARLMRPNQDHTLIRMQLPPDLDPHPERKDQQFDRACSLDRSWRTCQG